MPSHVFFMSHDDDGVALFGEFLEDGHDSTPVLESRLPVGSSARRIDDYSPALARWLTRWRWPPESSLVCDESVAEPDLRQGRQGFGLCVLPPRSRRK